MYNIKYIKASFVFQVIKGIYVGSLTWFSSIFFTSSFCAQITTEHSNREYKTDIGYISRWNITCKVYTQFQEKKKHKKQYT